MCSTALQRLHVSYTNIKPSICRVEEFTWVLPSWRNFPDETVFRNDSRLTAHTEFLYSPKYSQAASSAKESTNNVVGQPFKFALNLSSL